MRKKIRADRTMQKNQKMFPHAPLAASSACPTECAHLAVTTGRERSMSKRNKPIRIGIDLMGQDLDPEVLLKDIQKASLPAKVELLFVGLPQYARLASPFSYHSASEVIEMNESPLSAIRRKKNSSLCEGLRLLKEKKIDAFISAGNTGALVSAAKIILGMQPHFSRPALMTFLPTLKNPVAVLDVGANVETKAEHLVQFAFMGADYQKRHGIQKPTVALLNIGSEPIKGTPELRTAYEQLKNHQNLPFHFAGNVEGTAVFDGHIDVLITSGFTGNVFLKTAEGVAQYLLKELFQLVPSDVLAPHLALLKKKMHYEEYSGAILAGVRGHILKCHGYSSSQSFVNTIYKTIEDELLC